MELVSRLLLFSIGLWYVIPKNSLPDNGRCYTECVLYVSRNTFYFLYSKVFFAQNFKVPSLSRLLFHCSLCDADFQVRVILGKIPPLPPSSPLVVRTSLSKFLTRKDTWSCWPLLFVTALPWTTLFYEFVIVFLMTMFILPVVVSCTQTFVANWCLSNLWVKTHCAGYSVNKWLWLCCISSVHWMYSLAFPLTHALLWDLCVCVLHWTAELHSLSVSTKAGTTVPSSQSLPKGILGTLWVSSCSYLADFICTWIGVTVQIKISG